MNKSSLQVARHSDEQFALWAEEYRAEGFLNIPDLLHAHKIEHLCAAFAELEQKEIIRVGKTRIIDYTDIIFMHEAFAEVLSEPSVKKLLTALLGSALELYDTKFINKPLNDSGLESFAWHQDYAFYPHTNFDLLAFAIHLDEENEQSGAVRLIPGSHLWGPLSHCRNGSFLRCLTDIPADADQKSVLLTGPQGFVTVHHCLTVHSSAPKQRSGNRRIAYYDVRAQDNVQLAGYIRRSAGYPLTFTPMSESRFARFPDGSRVELRGAFGTLLDPFGRLGSDVGHVKEEE